MRFFTELIFSLFQTGAEKNVQKFEKNMQTTKNTIFPIAIVK